MTAGPETLASHFQLGTNHCQKLLTFAHYAASFLSRKWTKRRFVQRYEIQAKTEVEPFHDGQGPKLKNTTNGDKSYRERMKGQSKMPLEEWKISSPADIGSSDDEYVCAYLEDVL